MSIQKYLDNFVALNDSELAKFNKKERMAYEDSLKQYRDLYNILNYAREEGEEKGISKGEKRKAIDMTKEINTNEGLSFEDIAERNGIIN